MAMQTDKGLIFHVLGDGPEAVLCHPSLGLGRFLFHRLQPRWSARYAVVSWDPRGVGDNRLLAPSLEAMVADTEDIAAVLDRPVHLVGVSLGSFVMARVAAQAAGRIQTVALVSTSVGFSDGAAMVAERARRIESQGMVEYARAYSQEVLTEFARPEVRENLAQELADMDSKTYLETMAFTYAVDNGPVFAQVQQPTLVVVGTLDQVTPPAEAEIAARVLPNSWLAVVPRAGHLIPLDQPLRLDETLQEFWQA